MGPTLRHFRWETHPQVEIFNLFSQFPESSSDELFQELVGTEHVRIERIISHGQASPPGFWYDQECNEWVMVLKGSAGLMWGDDGNILVLRPGDSVNIRAHRKHRVAWTDPAEPTIWLAVFY